MKNESTLLATAIAFLLAAGTVADEPPKKELTIELTADVKLTLVRVEPGEFLMGAPETDPCAYASEKPQRRVKITQTFYLGKYEVTRRQFRSFVTGTKHITHAEKNNHAYNWHKPGFAITDAHPIGDVSWDDAKAFCTWLQAQPNPKALGVKEARLPTEAEWEYACRAGTTTRFYSGDRRGDLKEIGNVADIAYKRAYTFTAGSFVPWNDGYDFSAPVGKFKPNAFGLYDMIGNVGEWCQDYFGPYKDLPAVDPVRSVKYDGTFGTNRIWRGGTYHCDEGNLRASSRFHATAEGQVIASDGLVGFRVLVRMK